MIQMPKNTRFWTFHSIIFSREMLVIIQVDLLLFAKN